ncbi:hypothetical protein KS4_22260 [Poriferisphaera corsica]|uniref:PEP-CTERM protein-sorting domain-containing protein n=1 Tax=Poriferisphaera corsica TaxID=2528020 RepID=A0A517YVB4_9BACT|nr:hypothetical protein [Poriferisphaera corsica]QDU34164.1 hypothetical protein KS4_22260 [Poriferisphaera corsica]
MNIKLCSTVIAIGLSMAATDLLAANITVDSRSSYGRLRVHAGSGGASGLLDENDATTALAGAFGFNLFDTKIVTPTSPFSLGGAAESTGNIHVTDNVSLTGSGSQLTLSASRAAAATTIVTATPATATSKQVSSFDVSFTLGAQDATFDLSGSFDASSGDTTSAILFNNITTHQRYLPLNLTEQASYDGTLDYSGTLTAGHTYRLYMTMTSDISGNINTPASNLSNYGLTLNVSSVPEPASMLLMSLPALLLLRRRVS